MKKVGAVLLAAVFAGFASPPLPISLMGPIGYWAD